MGARRVGTLVMAAMLAVGLTACGDDGDDGEDVALEDVDGSGSASGTEEPDESDDEAAEDESDDSGGDIDLGGFSSERCQELFGALSGFGAAFSGEEGDIDFGDIGDAFEAMADEAPEIADELEVLAQAYRDFDEEFGDIDFTDPDVITSDEFSEAGAAFATPEFTEASDTVNDFLNEQCA